MTTSSPPQGSARVLREGLCINHGLVDANFQGRCTHPGCGMTLLQVEPKSGAAARQAEPLMVASREPLSAIHAETPEMPAPRPAAPQPARVPPAAPPAPSVTAPPAPPEPLHTAPVTVVAPVFPTLPLVTLPASKASDRWRAATTRLLEDLQAQVVALGDEDQAADKRHREERTERRRRIAELDGTIGQVRALLDAVGAAPVVTGVRTGARPGPRSAGRWAVQYDACTQCGTTARKHSGGGLCWRCYQAAQKAAKQAGD